MELVKLYCDHCGIELKDGEAYANVEIDAGKYYNPHIDLCEHCYNELNDILVHYIEHKGFVTLENSQGEKHE